MTEIEELIARLEKATGPDRDLDRAIMQAVTFWPAGTDAAKVMQYISDESVPLYTASLDAEFPIEREGFWEVSGPRRYLDIPDTVPIYWRAEFMPWRSGRRLVAWAATEPLARRIVALRAIAQDRESGR